jgi:predicted DNA-binding transcriptional regulator AlpA
VTIQPEFWNTSAVRQFFGGVSKMWVNRRMNGDPKFPRAHYFGSKTPHWRISEIRAYAEQCGRAEIPNVDTRAG